MSVRTVAVDASTRTAFVAYALAHGREHDESFVEPEDLAGFDPSKEAAALVLGEDGAALGAASLILAGYADEGMARFRILHASTASAYRDLIANVTARAPAAVERFFAFMPDDAELAATLVSLGFVETRRAHVLRREGPSPPALAPPHGVRIEVADPERDAAAWASVANAAFRGFPGRYDMTAELASDLLSRKRVLPGGALMARRGRAPAGIVLVVNEQDEADTHVASIDALATMPADQGAGLGRCMLRTGVRLALDTGYDVVDLSTNALNERALALYRSEGFDFIDIRVCWTLERGRD